MTDKVDIQISSKDSLAAALQPILNEIDSEEIVDAEIESEDPAEVNKEDKKPEEPASETEIGHEEKPAEDEKENKESSEESENDDFERALSGQPKEFKELVKSIKDPELRAKTLEAGRVARAREDRLASDLGMTKKQLAEFEPFRQMYNSSPEATIRKIAEMAKIDLKKLVTPIAEHEDSDDSEYYTPEERAEKEELKNIKKEINFLKQQRQAEQQMQIDQEIESFANDKEKYPYFDDLSESMTDLLKLETMKKGLPLTSQERVFRLQNAYKKALLLDETISAKREAEIAAKNESDRKKEVEKAKTLKKVSSISSNPTVAASSPREANAKALRAQGFI